MTVLPTHNSRLRMPDDRLSAIVTDIFGGLSTTQIIQKHNVSPATLSGIRNGKKYADRVQEIIANLNLKA